MSQIKINDIAMVCHELNRAYCQALGDDSQPPWEDAPDWQKNSALCGVIFHMSNPDAGDSASHDNWLADKKADGWEYGPVKDPQAKRHPCIMPFDQLPLEQQIKDRLFRQTVHALLAMSNKVIAPGGLTSIEEPGESCVFFTDGNGNEVIRLTNEGMEYKGELVKDAGEAYRAMITYLRRTNPELQTDADMRQIDSGMVMDAVNSLMAMTRYATEFIQAQEVPEEYMIDDLKEADSAASALIDWLDDDPVIQEEK